MSNILSYPMKHKFWSAVIIVAIVAGGWYWYSKAHTVQASVQYVTTPVAQQTITSSVTGSGQVSNLNSINLVPQASGTLRSIDVKQGQQVTTGQTIATVDQSTQEAALSQAEAGLASAKANYEAVMAGATPTTLTQGQLSVQAAQQGVTQAQANYTQVVAQQKLAVSNALSDELNVGLAAIPSGTNESTATVAVSGTYTGTQQGSYVIQVEASGNGPEYSLNGLEFSPPTNTVTRGVPQAIGKDGLFITFSSNGTLVADDTWTINLPNTSSSSYLGTANSYQSALQSQTTAIANAQNQIASAQLSLQQAQAGYANTAAPPTTAQVDSAQASLDQAQASVQSAEISLQDTVITAPFSGQIAELDYTQTGVQVGSSDTIAVLTTAQQITTISLNEVDVSKVAVGDKVTMTFNAVPNLTITGTVGQVDNIGTTTQGVVNYNVQVVFDVPSTQVKSGMSVDAAIITAVAPDAIVVPNSAIKTSGTGSYVQVLGSNGQPTNVTVQTGIASDTLTQVTSGLTVGQNVVTETISSTATTAAKTTATTSLLPSLTGAGAGTRAGGFTGGGAGLGGAARGGTGG